MPRNPYLRKLPEASETIYSVPPQCLVYLNVCNNEAAAKLLSTSHDANFTPRLTDWLAARTERVLALVVKYDASVHTVTCKLFHYSSSVMFFYFF